MAARSHPRANRTGARRKRRRRRSRIQSIRHLAGSCWQTSGRMFTALRASPPTTRVLLGMALLLLLLAGVNWLYHTAHKPTEVLFPLDHALAKSPSETWREYGALFREHSTAVISPELLAALAQVEGAGNPAARTYWRWRQTGNPLEWYRPASSAVGMYQITDGTFDAAKRYCVHDHVVVEDGPWQDLKSCWFNSLYTRVLPSHAIELTAAYLDRHVARAMGIGHGPAATLQRKQELAAIIHLCGAGAGQAYARRGFRLLPGQRCGDHDVRVYLARVAAMKQQFARFERSGRVERVVTGR